jgi:hypothetical protein
LASNRKIDGVIFKLGYKLEENKDIKAKTKITKKPIKKASPSEQKNSIIRKFNLNSIFKNEAVIAVALLIVLIGGVSLYLNFFKPSDIGIQAIEAKAKNYITANLVQSGTSVTVQSVTTKENLYAITMLVGSQKAVVYATKDGEMLFPQGYDISKTSTKLIATSNASSNGSNSSTETSVATTKAAVPTVDLFIMSYCPYGLQMERGLLPVVSALGNKVNFTLEFVNYTLHGQKEVTENVNQYCIQKTQPTKLIPYLECFWKNSAGESSACMQTAGIDSQQVSTCVTATNKQYSPTQSSFSIDNSDNVKYGVQGSPTLVVNGTTLSPNRDSESLLKAICSGFTTQPSECNQTLSSTSPNTGFDDENN